MNLKNYLLENWISSTGRFDRRNIKKIPLPVIESINQKTIKCEGSFNERIYWILNDLEDYDKSCLICGSKIKNKYSGLTTGYIGIYCSSKCVINDPETNIKRSISLIEKHGKDAHKIITAKGKEKRDKTNTEIYGGISPMCSIVTQTKVADSIEKIYGVRNIFQVEEIKNQIKETNLLKFGSESAIQNFEIFKKSQRKNNFKRKELKLPSGKIHRFQGYEDIAILSLLKTYNETEIELDEIPCIKYVYEKDRIYYPDIFIPKENLIIEVKSFYTYKQNLSVNLLKAKACIDQGFNFEFYICTQKELLLISNCSDLILLSLYLNIEIDH